MRPRVARDTTVTLWLEQASIAREWNPRMFSRVFSKGGRPGVALS